MTRNEIDRQFFEAIRDFCLHDYTDEQIISRFAPQGAVVAGGRLLPPGTAYVTRTPVVTSLYTGNVANQVVWWMNPRIPGAAIQELHVVPDGPARIVPYEDFVQRHNLGAALKTTQSGALSDLEHQHVFTCGDRHVTVTLHQIVWQGEVVGKLGEIVLKR